MKSLPILRRSISLKYYPKRSQMRRFLILLAMCMPMAVHALGRNLEFEDIMTGHPNHIDWVTTCGSWSSHDGDGVYRVVHASVYGQSFLYIQWLQLGEKNAIRRTLSIPELNNDHADILLEKLQCIATQSGVTIRADADFAHDDKKGAIEVRVGYTFGEYRFIRL